MAATVDEIESALLAPFLLTSDGGSEEWTGTGYDAIAYDNASFTPSAAPWIEVVTSAGRQSRLGVGPVYGGHPTLTVYAHTAIGTGKAAARALIDEAVALYKGRVITAGSSTMQLYSYSPPVEMPADGYYKLGCMMSFRLF